MKRSIVSTMLAIIAVTAIFIPAYAITEPDSISILSAKVVIGTIDPGDWAIVFHYNLHYDDEEDIPEIPASDSFMFRLYSPDGGTLLNSSVPYVFFDNGYGQGVSSFYFSAADVIALDLDWNVAYKINIAGNPVHFDPLPDPYFYALNSSNYSSVEGPTENQEIMKSYIISVCRLMEQSRPDYILHGATDVGTVLTAIGEAYFRGAVPGITAIAPRLFFTQFYVPEGVEFEYTTELAETYKVRLEDSDIMEGFANIGTKMGISGQTVAAFAIILASIGLIVWLTHKGWGVEPGILGAGLIMSFGAVLLGDAIMVMRIFMGFLGGMMIMYLLFLRKA